MVLRPANPKAQGQPRVCLTNASMQSVTPEDKGIAGVEVWLEERRLVGAEVLLQNRVPLRDAVVDVLLEALLGAGNRPRAVLLYLAAPTVAAQHKLQRIGSLRKHHPDAHDGGGVCPAVCMPSIRNDTRVRRVTPDGGLVQFQKVLLAKNSAQQRTHRAVAQNSPRGTVVEPTFMVQWGRLERHACVVLHQPPEATQELLTLHEAFDEHHAVLIESLHLLRANGRHRHLLNLLCEAGWLWHHDEEILVEPGLLVEDGS
mmetsp:Transcript_104911/g.306419  ORF Transcript_104911/g.306419 Transcript_104911/m.306419 type:complete len:258 (+) Transcript_104911:250-1023(+)